DVVHGAGAGGSAARDRGAASRPVSRAEIAAARERVVHQSAVHLGELLFVQQPDGLRGESELGTKGLVGLCFPHTPRSGIPRFVAKKDRARMFAKDQGLRVTAGSPRGSSRRRAP